MELDGNSFLNCGTLLSVYPNPRKHRCRCILGSLGCFGSYNIQDTQPRSISASVILGNTVWVIANLDDNSSSICFSALTFICNETMFYSALYLSSQNLVEQPCMINRRKENPLKILRKRYISPSVCSLQWKKKTRWVQDMLVVTSQRAVFWNCILEQAKGVIIAGLFTDRNNSKNNTRTTPVLCPSFQKSTW